MSIIPEFITPEYIHISIDTTVRYDKNISTLNSVDIRNSIDETIRNYFSQNLQKFDSDFVFSKLSNGTINNEKVFLFNLIIIL